MGDFQHIHRSCSSFFSVPLLLSLLLLWAWREVVPTAGSEVKNNKNVCETAKDSLLLFLQISPLPPLAACKSVLHLSDWLLCCAVFCCAVLFKPNFELSKNFHLQMFAPSNLSGGCEFRFSLKTEKLFWMASLLVKANITVSLLLNFMLQHLGAVLSTNRIIVISKTRRKG